MYQLQTSVLPATELIIQIIDHCRYSGCFLRRFWGALWFAWHAANTLKHCTGTVTHTTVFYMYGEERYLYEKFSGRTVNKWGANVMLTKITKGEEL